MPERGSRCFMEPQNAISGTVENIEAEDWLGHSWSGRTKTAPVSPAMEIRWGYCSLSFAASGNGLISGC